MVVYTQPISGHTVMILSPVEIDALRSSLLPGFFDPDSFGAKLERELDKPVEHVTPESLGVDFNLYRAHGPTAKCSGLHTDGQTCGDA